MLLQCELKPSRLLRRIRLLLLMLAVAGLSLADLSPPVRLAAALLIALAYWRARPELAVLALRCRDDGRLELRAAHGWQEAEILPGSVVWPRYCALRLRTDRRQQMVTVLPDSLEAGTFRRLRVWLRWRAAVPQRPGWSALPTAKARSQDKA